MPVPKPRKGEKERDFISRCISELSHLDPERPQKQIIAMCYTSWRQKESRHADFQSIFDRFVMFFGEEEGQKMYSDFLRQNGLDETKPYNLDQILGESLTESFEWTEPLIKFWKHDKEAKYYKTRLLTANVSMNLNDYSDPEQMEFAASNLAWRPVNIDHLHELRLPFPDNRIEVGRMSEEGNSIEAVIRIANSSKKIQDMIEVGEIKHPSIEAHPVCGITKKEGKNVPACGYYLDEVALLRKQYKLPGDPLSQIYPLPINEALGNSLVESLQNFDHGILVNPKEKNGEYKPQRGENMSDNKEETEEQFADLPDSSFACIIGEGDSKIRKLPIPDAAHTRNAMARYNQAAGCQTAEVKAKICRAARKFNIENAFEKGGFCYTGESAEHLEELSKKDTEIAELAEQKVSLEERIQVLEERNAKDKAKLKEIQGRLRETERRVMDRDNRIDILEKDNDKFREDVGKLTEARENAISEKNIFAAKAAKEAERANRETEERARIQRELAQVREDYANAVKREGETSQKRADDAKMIFRLQNENKEHKEREETTKVEIKKLRHLSKVQAKVLEKLGYKQKR